MIPGAPSPVNRSIAEGISGGIVELGNEFGGAVWATMLELAPWLLIGSAVAGILHGILPKDFVRRHLTGSAGVFKAVAFGVPLPLCSCGVIPAGLGLRRDGASKGAAIGFLTSTPQTGVDSILVSASFLGWPFALFKVVAALVSGLVSGWTVNTFAAGNEPDEGVHAAAAAETAAVSGIARLVRMVDHAVEILRSVWRWLVFGVLLSAAIQVFVPDAWLQGLGALGPLGAGFAALAVSLPLYVCATASVPIAAALVAGGMPTGAAMVFLMAGPATNVATVGAVLQGFGAKVLAIYLGTLVVVSLGAGVLFEQFVPNVGVAGGTHQHGTSTWALIATLGLTGLLIWFAYEDVRRRISSRGFKGGGGEPNLANPQLSIPIDGMTCTGCSGNVERALRRLPGVESVAVSLDPGCAMITGIASETSVVEAIRQAGYSPFPGAK